jgi:hypothetical protein
MLLCSLNISTAKMLGCLNRCNSMSYFRQKSNDYSLSMSYSAVRLQIDKLARRNRLPLVPVASKQSGIFWRDGKDLGGWVLGLSFLCSIVCFVFLLTYLFFGFITSCCISLLYVIKIPNDFLSLSMSYYNVDWISNYTITIGLCEPRPRLGIDVSPSQSLRLLFLLRCLRPSVR